MMAPKPQEDTPMQVQVHADSSVKRNAILAQAVEARAHLLEVPLLRLELSDARDVLLEHLQRVHAGAGGADVRV